MYLMMHLIAQNFEMISFYTISCILVVFFDKYFFCLDCVKTVHYILLSGGIQNQLETRL
jgi:hypothetical protein